MQLKIVKANGNGNTFLLINKKNTPKLKFSKNQIIQIRKNNNERIDGIILLEYNKSDNVKMDYYNNDGTWETLCINGIRCSALYLNKEYNKSLFTFKCGDERTYLAKVLKKSLVNVTVPEPCYRGNKLLINNISGYFLDSGAKHFVIKIDSNFPSKKNLIEIARGIRYNENIFIHLCPVFLQNR